jgi:hypothetical protein
MHLQDIWRWVARLLVHVLGERIRWLPTRIAERLARDGACPIKPTPPGGGDQEAEA